MNDRLHALPPGHRVGDYQIGHVLGSGSFGITYYAEDTRLGKPFAIKEYLPNEFALRAAASTVKPKSTADQADYQWGLERFLDEARTLARFQHPHLNEVYRFFEENGTAYIVLEYIEGETLSALLKREGRLDLARLRRLLDELLSGLDEIHKAGFVHRDIKPANIMFRDDGSAVLLDFGAARQAIGRRSQSITSILTPGYAPIEQYDQSTDDVGPWSDLYALGMVAYRCISGIRDGELLDAVARARLERKGARDKDMVAAQEIGKHRYDEALLGAVDWAIEVNEERRPQSGAAIRDALAGGNSSNAAVKLTGRAIGRQAPSLKPSESQSKERWRIWLDTYTEMFRVSSWRGKAFTMIVAIWIFSFFFGSLILFGVTSRSSDRDVVWFLFSVLVPPVLVIISTIWTRLARIASAVLIVFAVVLSLIYGFAGRHSLFSRNDLLASFASFSLIGLVPVAIILFMGWLRSPPK